jgi:hypothetical protein
MDVDNDLIATILQEFCDSVCNAAIDIVDPELVTRLVFEAQRSFAPVLRALLAKGAGDADGH